MLPKDPPTRGENENAAAQPHNISNCLMPIPIILGRCHSFHHLPSCRLSTTPEHEYLAFLRHPQYRCPSHSSTSISPPSTFPLPSWPMTAISIHCHPRHPRSPIPSLNEWGFTCSLPWRASYTSSTISVFEYYPFFILSINRLTFHFIYDLLRVLAMSSGDVDHSHPNLAVSCIFVYRRTPSRTS